MEKSNRVLIRGIEGHVDKVRKALEEEQPVEPLELENRLREIFGSPKRPLHGDIVMCHYEGCNGYVCGEFAGGHFVRVGAIIGTDGKWKELTQDCDQIIPLSEFDWEDIERNKEKNVIEL